MGRFQASNVRIPRFLLYLNDKTYQGDAGEKLAEELRKACTTEPLPIVIMAHENDRMRGGCEFDTFFSTTPYDLITDGLYSALAFSMYPGEKHRAVSMALLRKALTDQAREGRTRGPSSKRRTSVLLSRASVTASSFKRRVSKRDVGSGRTSSIVASVVTETSELQASSHLPRRIKAEVQMFSDV